jgi:hypothetical protein
MKYTLHEGARKNYYRQISVLVFVAVCGGLTGLAVLPPLASGRTIVQFPGRKKPAVSVAAASQANGSSHAPPKNTSTAAQVKAAIQNKGVVTAATATQSLTAVRSGDCSAAPAAHAGLAQASASTLRVIAQYEQVCGAAIASGGSFFVPTPRDGNEAASYAAEVAAQLQEYARFGIQPVVFMEPTYPGGTLDFNTYKAGAYDGALQAYFAALKAHGITDATLGTWVLFPEGNIPVWGNVDAATYTANVTRTAQFLRAQFPGGRTSLLLDSQTYPSGANWSGGRYVSLLPYISGIPKGLISSFGLQGFPWAAPAGETGSLYDPNVYLATNLAAEAARNLGTSEVWLNTGTFGAAYTGAAAKQVTIGAAQRQTMLDGVVARAQSLRSQGFSVTIHVFAQDKSATSEGINWSYWSANQPGAGDAAPIFKAFVHDLQAAGISLWLFDVAS